MGYGYMAIATKSTHDDYLVGNPQFTYFKKVYRKHTNFSTSFKEVLFQQDTEECWGKKIYVTVPKEGDLVHRMYLNFELELEVQSGNHIHSKFIYSIIEHIDLYIGDQLIDRHYSEWLHIWHELFETSNQNYSLSDMICLNKVNVLYNNTPNKKTCTFSIPLRFWFNNNVGLSLPLIALYNADVKFEVRMIRRGHGWPAALAGAIIPGNPTYPIIKKVNLLLENFYLDKEEKRMFSKNKHEYLITQAQSGIPQIIPKGLADPTIKYKLDFKYPVKEIFWRVQDQSKKGYGQHEFNYWNKYEAPHDQFLDAKISINNTTITNMPAFFYRGIQRYEHHNSGSIQGLWMNPNPHTFGSGLYMYSFALNPTNHQPSGTLNFSKAENSYLQVRVAESYNSWAGEFWPKREIRAFALNYNVFRIMSGLGGLAFTN